MSDCRSAFRQCLSRLRPPLPRYVGCRGLCHFGGNGAVALSEDGQGILGRANGTNGEQRCCCCFR